MQGADSNKVAQLTEGQIHPVEVVVTAEDGQTTKTYTIAVRRLSANDATLAQLEVSAGILHPVFSPLVTEYECYLPCSLENLSLRAKTEDEAMKLSMKDGSPVGTVQLNPGYTLIELSVTSVSGTSTTIYKILAAKCRLPSVVQLKNKNPALECAVCSRLADHPSHIKDGPYIYCNTCLGELTRQNKVDPFTNQRLEAGWMVTDYQCDSELAKLPAMCHTPTGTVEATMQQIGAKLRAERAKSAQTEEVNSHLVHSKLNPFFKHLKLPDAYNIIYMYSVFSTDLLVLSSPLSLLRVALTAARKYQFKTCRCTKRCSVLLTTLHHCPNGRYMSYTMQLH